MLSRDKTWLCCFVGLSSGVFEEERWEVIRHCTSHLVRAAAPCSFPYRRGRVGLVRVGGRWQLSLTSGIWLGSLFGDAFPPSAHPLHSCPLLWLGGYLNTLNREGKYCCCLHRHYSWTSSTVPCREHLVKQKERGRNRYYMICKDLNKAGRVAGGDEERERQACWVRIY